MLTSRLRHAAVTTIDFLAKWAAVAAMIFMACTAVLITMDASGRYVFNAPIQGVHDIVQGFLQPAVIFLAIALAARQDAHLKIELITLRHYPVLRRWREVLFNISISAFWAVCGWQAGARAWSAYVQKQWPVGEIAVPDVIAYGVTAFGCFLAAIAHLFPARNPAVSEVAEFNQPDNQQ